MNFTLAYSLVRKNLADFTEMRIRAKALFLFYYVIARNFALMIIFYVTTDYACGMARQFYVVGGTGGLARFSALQKSRKGTKKI